ncbi:hypothetical protein [Pectobacterium aroidearum]|uniref:hypothetical protein n=1 Tax=Pectobacterium aroidearum TaxID=1201031 RepID=UPI002A820E19|nr:hypothetical protein [Pectobacterium aroidearum]MDY4385616.1 hypothetical protein [Pectobacterium aroidearum]
MTISPYINHAIDISLSEGNSVKEVSDGWSNMEQVIFFSKKMSQSLRLEIKNKEPKLRYFSTDRTLIVKLMKDLSVMNIRFLFRIPSETNKKVQLINQECHLSDKTLTSGSITSVLSSTVTYRISGT